MPAYNNTPGQSVTSLAPGQNGFSFGSQQLQGAPIAATITASPGGAVRTSNVVTITTSAAHGFQVGQYVNVNVTTVVGATSFNGSFVIASVPSTTTFTYAQTAADDTGGGGTASCPSNVQVETIPTVNTAGKQFAIAAQTPPQGRTVTYDHRYNIAPTAVGVTLQGAMNDVDSQYTDISTDGTPAGNSVTITGVQYRFLRLRVSALTLGSGAGMTASILV